MATPDFVKFSRVHRPLEEFLERLEEGVFRTHGLAYDRAAGLVVEKDPLTAKYNGGLDLGEELAPCRTRAEVLEKAASWPCFGVTLLARRVPASVYLYVFDVTDDGWSTALSFDTSMLTYKTTDLEKGEWMRGLLIGMVAALGCDVAGYGADKAYSLRYEALSPEEILKRLRAGELFTMGYPNFHAIAVSLIGVEEMNDLLRRLPRSRFLQYRLSTAGYHILSIIP